MDQNCPNLGHFLNKEQCLENIAGTSAVAYFFVKSDLEAPLTLTGCEYSTPTFAAGKGIYKFDVKDESQQVKGESQGPNAGFALTWNAILERVNMKAAELSRALNNLDICIIIPDSDSLSQILYDPIRRVKAEQGGIASDTGAAVGDDRQVALEFHLNGVLYDNLYVKAPKDGWETLMVSE